MREERGNLNRLELQTSLEMIVSFTQSTSIQKHHSEGFVSTGTVIVRSLRERVTVPEGGEERLTEIALS